MKPPESAYAALIIVLLSSLFGWAVLNGAAPPQAQQIKLEQRNQARAQEAGHPSAKHAQPSEDGGSEHLAMFGYSLKFGEFLLVLVTLLLFGATGWLAVATQQLRKSGEEIYRAYVSGGVNFAIKKGEQCLVVVINNYGKTPGIIGTVTACVLPEGGPFPPQPPYIDLGLMGYVLPEGTTGYPSTAYLPLPTTPSIVCGRIFYRDAFKQCRSVGFALTIEEGLPAAKGVPESYWEDRKEASLRPAQQKAA